LATRTPQKHFSFISLKRIFQLGKFAPKKKEKKKEEKQSHIQSPNKEPSEAPKVIHCE
jgi:hypothetical protein